MEIELNKNLRKEVKLILAILYQNNYKAKNINVEDNIDKAEVNKNNLA